MAGTLTPTPYQTVLDGDGVAVSGAKITTTDTGTGVNSTTYTSADLSVANTNPIVADSAGRYVAYLPAGANLTFAITTSADVAIETQTNILSVPGASVNLDVEGTVGVAVSAGAVLYLSSAAEATPLTAGLWYLTDADAAPTSTTPQSIGVAVSAIAINASGTIRLAGLVTTAGAVVVGTTYYVSATAGALASSAPALSRQVGVAMTTSSLLLAATTAVVGALPNPITQDLLFTDATYDIGKSGATRPRDGFFSRNAVVGGTLGVSGISTFTADLVATTASMSFQDAEGVTFGTGNDATVKFDGTDLVIAPAAVGAGDVHVSGGSVEVDDSESFTLGTGKDATIIYDGTDLTISPAAVGSGDLVIAGASAEFADSEGVTLGTGKDATLQYDGTNVEMDTQAVGSGLLVVTGSASVSGVEIDNTATDGDPTLAFTLSGTSLFTMGVDDGDSDKFKIGTTSIGASTALTIDGSTSFIGIGTTSPGHNLEVAANSPRIGVNGVYGAGIHIDKGSASRVAELRYETAGITDWYLGTTNSSIAGDGTEYFIGTAGGGLNAVLTIEKSSAARVRIDAAGHLLVGHSSAIPGFSGSNFAAIQATGTTDDASTMQVARFSNNIYPPQFSFLKSRGSIGADTIVQDGDRIGCINYLPNDGSDFNTHAACFKVEVDDPSPAANDIGLAFVFEQMPGGGGGALRETMRITAGGQLLISHSSSVPTFGATNFALQVSGTGDDDSGMQVARFSNNSAPSQFSFLKSRGGIGAYTIVQDGDRIGCINYLPADGSDFDTHAACFKVEVDDASPAAGYIGTAFVFEQQPGGSGALRETMRISAAGYVGIGVEDPADLLHIEGATNPSIRVQRTASAQTVNLEFWNESDAFVAGVGVSSDSDDLILFAGNTATEKARLYGSTGNFNITGALSKASGSFKIDHPLPELADTHHLVHSFLEGPRADLIYRGTVVLVDGSATANLDVAAGMTVGTWVLLCRDAQVFTSNETSYNHIRGSVSGSILTIECEEATCTDTISWMVVAERMDQHMIETSWTDENGRPILEPLKPPDPPDPEEDDDDDEPA
jgi:hypothetical protein